MHMNEFLHVFALNRKDVENWVSRPTINLSTTYQKTVSGRAREFSKANVLELALIGSFVAVGFKASAAAEFTREVIKDHKKNVNGGYPYYAFWAPSANFGKHMRKLDPEKLAELIRTSPRSAISIVEVASIFERVEELFQNREDN